MASSRVIARLLSSHGGRSYFSKLGAPRGLDSARPSSRLALRNYSSGSPTPPSAVYGDEGKAAHTLEAKLESQNTQGYETADGHDLLKQRMAKLQGDMENMNQEMRYAEKTKLEASTEEMHGRLKLESEEFNDKLTSEAAILRRATEGR